MIKFDKKLCAFATVRQLEFIEAVEQSGSHRKAAKILGIAKSTITHSLLGLKARAARQGWLQHAVTVNQFATVMQCARAGVGLADTGRRRPGVHDA